MTREELNIKLKHFITCLKCEVNGRECDDNCPVQYEAGNMGEIIENLEAISKALEEEPKTAWIPVSERLPEGLLVKALVSCEDALGLPIVPKVALYDNYEHSWKCEEKVIAWMPLPASYKSQESEETNASND